MLLVDVLYGKIYYLEEKPMDSIRKNRFKYLLFEFPIIRYFGKIMSKISSSVLSGTLLRDPEKPEALRNPTNPSETFLKLP